MTSIIFGFVIFFLAYTAICVIGFSRKVDSEYIYHFTKKEHLNEIVKDGYATINGCVGFGSYSNFFRRTTFYFDGIPSLMQIRQNIDSNPKKIDKFYAIKIKASDLPPEINMKRRLLDGAVFHSGNLVNVPAEIEVIPRERLPLVTEPFLLIMYILVALVPLLMLYLLFF